MFIREKTFFYLLSSHTLLLLSLKWHVKQVSTLAHDYSIPTHNASHKFNQALSFFEIIKFFR